MPKYDPPSVTDLRIPPAARFVVLRKPLSKAAVKNIFNQVLQELSARAVTREIRTARGHGAASFVYSFLCFRYEPPVPFLAQDTFKELRYGFVLLIERKGYLAVFHRSAKGLEDPIAKASKPVDRRRITHIWANSARYQKVSTRRMSIAKQEMRGASYEADDLETAFVPATAARSILQTIRMATAHGNVGVTPGTGRVRVSTSRATLSEMLSFIDETIKGIETETDSSFLSSFPEPVDLDELPEDVAPVGLLVHAGDLRELLDDSDDQVLWSDTAEDETPDALLDSLAPVLSLERQGDEWDVLNSEGIVLGRLKRLKHSYSLYLSFAADYTIEGRDGTQEPLSNWFRRQAAFSISFSSPEYFYAEGKLYRKAGFNQEVAQVRRFLHAHPALDAAVSEKGGPYTAKATHFSGDSIFRIVETRLASGDRHLWCCDLGDEWADYIGVAPGSITFYHCKDGDPTTGASDFQIVVGQALKNLARVGFRREEVEDKVRRARQRAHWGATAIPLLAKHSGGWKGLARDLVAAVADAETTWKVALVVTALSIHDFDVVSLQPMPTPHFIQLVWLLSAFVSACRERGAQPTIYCRP